MSTQVASENKNTVYRHTGPAEARSLQLRYIGAPTKRPRKPLVDSRATGNVLDPRVVERLVRFRPKGLTTHELPSTRTGPAARRAARPWPLKVSFQLHLANELSPTTASESLRFPGRDSRLETLDT